MFMDKDGETVPWPELVDQWNRYRVGVDVRPVPGEDTEVKEMLHLVAYDISAPARLRKVAKLCEFYGARVEKSVFECDLSPEQFEHMWLRLIDLIDEDEDAVVAYRVCRSCSKETESMGIVRRPRKVLLYCL